MFAAPPTVNFGMLEDLMDEAEEDRRDGKTISMRVTTDFRTHGGGTIGEETTVSVIMYCLASDCWLTIRGGTKLVDLRARHEAVKPPEEVEGEA